MSGDATAPGLTLSYRPAAARAAVPGQTMFQLIAGNAARRPDALALVDGAGGPGTRSWTYRALEQRGTQVAAALLEELRPGDRVALWAPNSPDWVFFQIGAGLAGLILVTVNPAYQHAELAHVLRRSEARGIYAAREHRGRDLAGIAREVAASVPSVAVAGRLEDLIARADRLTPAGELPAVDPDDIAQIQYTSGTTGSPKGVRLRHGAISASYRQTLGRAGFDDDAPPTWINPMPLFHVGSAGGAVLGTMTLGGTHVVLPGFDPELVFRAVEAERGTITLAVPTMLISMLEHPRRRDYDLSSLRTILTGAAPVPAELVRRVQRELEARVVICFGQTEFSGNLSTTRLDDLPEDVAETVGVPFDDVEAKIVDPVSGAIVPIGTPGEICARGHQVMAGYHDAPLDTAAAIDPDGWLRFGDLGTMDDRGYLRVIGRLKDMIIRGGENIYPREIEDLLIAHPSVGDVAVVGAPDATWGEEVAAVIRPAEGAARPIDPAELFGFCREQLASYKCPRLWFVMGELPLTPSGKVRKRRLAAMIADGELQPAGRFVREVGQRPSAR